MLAYQEWQKEHNFKIVASEYRFYHRTRLYAGTADALFMDGDDLCLMDEKTSQTLLEGLTTAQLYGYSEALKSHGVEVERAYILHLKNDSTYDWIEVDTSKGRMMFEACAYLHGAVKKEVNMDNKQLQQETNLAIIKASELAITNNKDFEVGRAMLVELKPMPSELKNTGLNRRNRLTRRGKTYAQKKKP